MQLERLRPAAVLAGLVLLAAVFAQVEIQIEGAAGWAAGLPTWRIERHPLLDVFWGGRALTGYHVWVFLFMALVFHFGILLDGRATWRREARILGALMLFWILEDALWFALNPAFGLARLKPAFVPWHRYWLWGLPTDYVTFSAVGGLLLWLSFRRGRNKDAAP
jgi:hypothetical protein